GQSKILKKCSLPLTASHQANLIVTEMAVLSVEADGLHLLEIHPNYTIDDVAKATDANLIINKVERMKGV
ncbi:MAG: succinyl-CoA--3-ketoacid-CoA transferase, partial [Candidatus Izemoplasmatales bacterium]|nr:succinyl-CoA--3-ketoacid-CoA transferase [Candidatus Izemoplasmatales bacterium]